MTLEQSLPWFDEMSASEKILLLQDLWDRLAADSDQVETTARQREELDRRLECYHADPGATSAWDDVQVRIRASR